MALPFIIGNATSNIPGTNFDANNNALGAMGTLACTCSGTNTIALTQAANQPAVAAYANYQLFSFVAVNNSTNSVTVSVNIIGALNLYLGDGVTQAGSGSIVTGVTYIIVYNSALNSNAGGFQILAPAASSSFSASPITNSLSGDVTLTTAGTYYDGPSVAQGSVGTWFVSGSVTVYDTIAGDTQFSAKLWDGTTLIASATAYSTGGSQGLIMALSGYLVTPAGNLRISATDITRSTTGSIKFNASGLGKDSTITAFRIA